MPHWLFQPSCDSVIYCWSVRNDMLSGTETENISGCFIGSTIAPKPPIE